MSKPERLTKAEEEIMHFIWKMERCTVSDILEKYENQKPPHSTISSIVRILEKKGYVNHKAYGRTYEYFPLISKKEYTSRSLTKLVGDYFEGSPNQLVSFLVKEKGMSVKDLQHIISELEKDN